MINYINYNINHHIDHTVFMPLWNKKEKYMVIEHEKLNEDL